MAVKIPAQISVLRRDFNACAKARGCLLCLLRGAQKIEQ